jgi:hypothetical protein
MTRNFKNCNCAKPGDFPPGFLVLGALRAYRALFQEGIVHFLVPVPKSVVEADREGRAKWEDKAFWYERSPVLNVMQAEFLVEACL